MEHLGCHRRDFHKLWYFRFFRKFVEKIQVPLKYYKNKRHSTWRLFTFLTIPKWILLRMRNVEDTSCIENQNIFVFSNFFRKSWCLWDNIEKCGGSIEAADDDIIWRMLFACWVSEATCAHPLAHESAECPRTRTQAGTNTNTHECTHARAHTHALRICDT
jgi:hypothetical protein